MLKAYVSTLRPTCVSHGSLPPIPHEVCIPTVLHHYRLAIEDIGGDGEFVVEENINRFYRNTPGVDGLGPATFVCPPTQPISEVLPDKLYHAVK